MEQWALFAATAIEPAALTIIYAMDAGNADDPDVAAKIDASVEALQRPLARLEALPQDHDWLVDDRFTAGDIVVAECLRYAQGP